MYPSNLSASALPNPGNSDNGEGWGHGNNDNDGPSLPFQDASLIKVSLRCFGGR
jgi:hypothetical protein